MSYYVIYDDLMFGGDGSFLVEYNGVCHSWSCDSARARIMTETEAHIALDEVDPAHIFRHRFRIMHTSHSGLSVLRMTPPASEKAVPTEVDRARASRMVRLLLRLGGHEMDENMVEALACELAGIREDVVASVRAGDGGGA